MSDVGMPGRDGYDLAHELRARWPATPAIALSAFARPEDVELAHRAGYQRHLTKPIDPGHLVAGVAEILAATNVR